MVIDPHDPDREEADRVRDVRRPEIDEVGAEVAVRSLLDPDRQDQERDRDGENTVAEGLDAAGFHRPKLHLDGRRGEPRPWA